MLSSTDEVTVKIDQRIIELKKLRKLAGYSQKVFSKMIGVPLRTYQEHEQGRRVPSTTVLFYYHTLASNPDALQKLENDMKNRERWEGYKRSYMQ